jgi:DNA-binding NarL/FixJ family response regulator
MIRIIIADDHVMFRQGLLNLLASAADVSVVAHCGSGEEALDLVREHAPDVAVLDISMPGMDGIAVIRKLKAEELATQAVVLSMHDDPYFRSRALEAGARSYMLKDKAFEELLSAIRLAAGSPAGELPADRTAGLGREGRHTVLTERETQVLNLIACGCTNRMIAADLGISIKTVESHRTNLMNKLERHSTAELVRYAVKLGLV